MHFTRLFANNMLNATRLYVVGFLLFAQWCGAGAFLDCKDDNSVATEQEKCFERFSIPLQLKPPAERFHVQSAIFSSDPEVLCKKDYGEAVSCSYHVFWRCLRLKKISNDILGDSILDGIKFFCRHLSDMDYNCTRTRQPLMDQCTGNRSSKLYTGVDPSDVRARTCADYKVLYNCMKDILHACGRRTVQIQLELLNRYRRPSACTSFDPDCVDYEDSCAGAEIAVVIPATDLPEQPVSTDGRCNVYKLNVGETCFPKERVDPPRLQDYEYAVEDIVNAIISDEHSTDVACKGKQSYLRAMDCAQEQFKQCAADDESFNPYLPTSHSIQQTMDDLCDHFERRQINFTCARQQLYNHRECILEKVDQFKRPRTDRDVVCGGRRVTTECYNEIFPVCGCLTNQLYVKIKKGLYPPACPLLTVTTPVCDPVTGEYRPAGENGVSSPLVSSLSILMVSVGGICVVGAF